MSDFEKWFKTTEAYKMLEEQNYFKMDLFFFVWARKQYRHNSVQVAYLTWQHQQAIIDDLKAQLNNMEACYIEKKKQVEGQQKRVDDYEKLTVSMRNEFDLWSDDSEFADVVEAQIENLEALRGASD